MESVSSVDAHKFVNTTKYLYDTQNFCYDKCVVDFQTKDIGPMEKECALACLRKHMVIYKDLVKWNSEIRSEASLKLKQWVALSVTKASSLIKLTYLKIEDLIIVHLYSKD